MSVVFIASQTSEVVNVRVAHLPSFAANIFFHLLSGKLGILSDLTELQRPCVAEKNANLLECYVAFKRADSPAESTADKERRYMKSRELIT